MAAYRCSDMRIAGQFRHLNACKVDSPDHRDIRLMNLRVPESLFRSTDFTEYASGITDQGEIGSCTAHAATSAVEMFCRIRKVSCPRLSRLLTYFFTRKIEGTSPSDDVGATLRSTMKSLVGLGSCDEILWPYVPSHFDRAPGYIALKDCISHHIHTYVRCNGLLEIQQAMAGGHSVVCGFVVPESIYNKEVSDTGIILYPEPSEDLVGGHAIHLIGYDDKTRLVKFQNSWGTSWGDHGFGYLPYDYFLGNYLTYDLWAITA
jgi:C1A family cysteine protease